VDIGAHVEAGQVLAEIETPEIDEQLRQARATQAQTQANLGIAQTTFERWGKLFQTKAIAAQDYDERKAQVEAGKANVAAAEADVQRLTRLQEFQKVVAPYSGTITERHTDIGALVSGDNNASRMLFRLAQADTLRVFVNVPQSEYRLITQGVPAALAFREFPGRAFIGKVVRTAGALDPVTRTLRTEVQLPNEKGELIPGLYAEVKFNLLQDHPAVVVPSRAVIIQANGPQIATVDASDRVTLHAVGLGRDFGKTVEITTGLEPGDRFVTNPTDTLRDGALVRPEAPEPAKIAAK
jgi:RND family efflux transporter MFP subunit